MISLIVATTLIAAAAVRSAPSKVRANPALDWRVVGGEDAPEGAFPFIVSLRSAGDEHDCGGVIISENHLLTAAHCVDSSDPQYYTIVAGTNKISSGGVRYEVESVVGHEGYSFSNGSNDIALMKTKTPFNFSNPAIAAVGLPKRNPPDGTNVTLAGWGTLELDGEHPDNLQCLNLTTVSYEECRDILEAYGGFPVYTTQVCAFTAAGKGACHGDSGGPLVDLNNTLVGLVSWGIPCAKGYPDVYTRVYSFLDWIAENSGIHSE